MKAAAPSRRRVSSHLLVIPAPIARRWEPIITGTHSPRATRDGAIPGFSERLGDGYELDLNICPSSSSHEPPTVDAVLLLDGQEVCNDVYERLLGEIAVDHDGRTFMITVIAEPDSWAPQADGGQWLASLENSTSMAFRQALIDRYTSLMVAGGTGASTAARRLAQLAASS